MGRLMERRFAQFRETETDSYVLTAEAGMQYTTFVQIFPPDLKSGQVNTSQSKFTDFGQPELTDFK